MNKLKVLFIILVLNLTTELTNTQYIKVQKLKEQYSIYDNTFRLQQPVEEKYPIYAGTASFILPGFALGQLYNEQPRKFYRHIGITGGCVLLAVLGVANLNISMGGGPTNNTVSGWLLGISAAAFAGNWIWSVVDAVISSSNINKQIMLQKYRSDIMNKLKFGFNINKNKQFKINIAFSL